MDRLRTPVALFAGLIALLPAFAQSPAKPAPPRVSLDDLYAREKMPDVAISPSGRYLASVIRGPESSSVVVTDLETGRSQAVVGVGRDTVSKTTDALVSEVFWKSDQRLLFRMAVYPRDGVRLLYDADLFARLGDRLFAIDRDGTKMVRLLADNLSWALAGAFDLGSILSFLPRDPSHIMMAVDGNDGRSLFRVDVDTGRGEIVEKPSRAVVGWWLDLDGVPVVRVERWSSSYRLSRKDADGKWKMFYKVRISELEERPDYEAVGAADVPGEYYVLARPEGRDRIGLYRYNLMEERFGEPIVEDPRYDLVSAGISRDGKQVLWHCHVEHVRICQFADRSIDDHMRSVRGYFDGAANVNIYDVSEDRKVLILRVQGPHNPPAFHRYRVDRRRLESIGPVRDSLRSRAMPEAAVVEWQARDGLKLTGYLTRPPDSTTAAALPLVVYPHGGPEARDSLVFDPWVQFLAARGYAVFQPNFRGSDGFGKAFAELGHGQWGRAMQDDVTDGVRHLVARGGIDPQRICIVGASYGGYAALAGAALTPDLYRCAVSIAGISDLAGFIEWRRRKWGADSEGYTYWLGSIGDPKRDAAKLAETSPARRVADIRVPVLLIHGDDDGVVPVSQSVDMKKALDKAGRGTELIRLPKEGHSYWSDDNEKLALRSIDRFLWQHLGPGYGVTEAPPPDPPKGK